jgi:predicted PurR-regulated permease PerM
MCLMSAVKPPPPLPLRRKTRRSGKPNICSAFLAVPYPGDNSVRSAIPRRRYATTIMTRDRVRKAFLLVLVVSVTTVFLLMLRSFLVTILMAAIFSGLLYPSYQDLVLRFRSRTLAATVTVLSTLVLVIAPLLLVLGLVVNQAVRVTEDVRPVVERLISDRTYLEQQIERIPGFERMSQYRDEIFKRTGDVVNAMGGFLANSLSNATQGTVTFIAQFLLFLYTLFFLLLDGPAIRDAILRNVPLSHDEKEQMIDRFVSVTRASLKGTVVIGIIQGSLSGAAFAVAGIPNALFWTVLMIVLSILPVVGGALVWVPACIILAATGQVLSALLLAAFCAFVVGSVDNVLRPRLVGRDTKMHDLVILFSILGGILTFGPIGFIIGPIIAGLFVTSWSIFDTTYHDVIREDPVIHIEES